MKVWNQALQPVSVFQLSQNLLSSPVNATVGSIDVRFDASRNLVVLVGTYGGEIIEVLYGQSQHNTKQAASLVGLADGANFDLSTPHADVLQHSHYAGELWGLAAHPTDSDIVATVGDDATVRLWSISRKKMVSCCLINWPGRCLAWNPAGNLLAIGLHELTRGGWEAKKGKKGRQTKSNRTQTPGRPGCCVIISVSFDDNETPVLTEICRGGSSVAWISDIKFSPTGRWLAFGSHDKKLYMYNVPPNNDEESWSACLQKCVFPPYNKHSSAITHFDFSQDEVFLSIFFCGIVI